MNGIIADLLFSFVLSSEEEHRGYYQAMTTGYFDEIASLAGNGEGDFVMMTKLGMDNEGAAIREYYSKSSSLNLEFCESSSFMTAISVEGDSRVRYSSLADINGKDVVSFIDSYGISTLFISAVLLSFKPVSREIVSAVVRRKDKIERVIVDTSLDWNILLLEEVKECIEMMRSSSLPVSMVGEALSIDGVSRMSTMRRNEILALSAE